MNKKVVAIYHKDCSDGTAAAGTYQEHTPFSRRMALLTRGERMAFKAWQRDMEEEKRNSSKMLPVWKRIWYKISDSFSILPPELQNERKTKQVKRIIRERSYKEAVYNLEVEDTRTINVTEIVSGGSALGGGSSGGGGSTFVPTVVAAPVVTPIPTVTSPTTGQVLGVSTSCPDLLTSNMRFHGSANDKNEVKQLKLFLNMNLGTKLPITGFYGTLTRAAVNTFQVKYRDQVLTPLKLKKPTGNAYSSTRKMINALNCAAAVQL
jgi:hypothetical protein